MYLDLSTCLIATTDPFRIALLLLTILFLRCPRATCADGTRQWIPLPTFNHFFPVLLLYILHTPFHLTRLTVSTVIHSTGLGATVDS